MFDTADDALDIGNLSFTFPVLFLIRRIAGIGFQFRDDLTKVILLLGESRDGVQRMFEYAKHTQTHGFG